MRPAVSGPAEDHLPDDTYVMIGTRHGHIINGRVKKGKDGWLFLTVQGGNTVCVREEAIDFFEVRP